MPRGSLDNPGGDTPAGPVGSSEVTATAVATLRKLGPRPRRSREARKLSEKGHHAPERVTACGGTLLRVGWEVQHEGRCCTMGCGRPGWQQMEW